MRFAHDQLIACIAGLLASAGCGDNEPPCGHVEVLDANRNIWPGHIAVDAERVYYSDYDNGFGTHLVFRQPRDGGQPLVIGARGMSDRFGFGMATSASHLYWSAEDIAGGYHLLATPLLGGTTLELTAISTCTANGIAVDELAAYGGSVRCEDQPARVIAKDRDGGPAREVWTSLDADVSGLAATGGTVYIATSAGLQRVDAGGVLVLLDGRPTYHVVISGDQVVYSTDESIRTFPVAGGAPRTLYTFRTPVTELRAFAVDGDDLYIAEPPELVFVAGDAEPITLVRDIGAVVTHITARDGAAYWSTLAVRGSLGVIGSFSGAVMRVARPCR
jgi:hypothetical protein